MRLAGALSGTCLGPVLASVNNSVSPSTSDQRRLRILAFAASGQQEQPNDIGLLLLALEGVLVENPVEAGDLLA